MIKVISGLKIYEQYFSEVSLNLWSRKQAEDLARAAFLVSLVGLEVS